MAEPTIGQAAPDFTLTAHTGDEVSLSGYKNDKNVVLFFVRSPTCWQCRTHVEHLGRLYAEFKNQGTEVLVILNANLAKTQEYAAKVHAPFPVLADPGHDIYERYGLNKIFFFNTRTGSVIVDKDGKVSYMKSATNPGAWLKESADVLDHVKVAV